MILYILPSAKNNVNLQEVLCEFAIDIWYKTALVNTHVHDVTYN